LGLDSDVRNADSQLFVEFYTYEHPSSDTKKPYQGVPFVRIVVPGDKTNVVEQPVRESHKSRFPRQWLHFQMQNNDAAAIGTPLKEWHETRPSEFNQMQMEELSIMKFQTVEQVATASDMQLQKVGMGAAGLRERARAYLLNKNQSDSQVEMEKTKQELAELKEQLAAFMAEKKVGRPKKEE
jgi:hypothetical protein